MRVTINDFDSVNDLATNFCRCCHWWNRSRARYFPNAVIVDVKWNWIFGCCHCIWWTLSMLFSVMLFKNMKVCFFDYEFVMLKSHECIQTMWMCASITLLNLENFLFDETRARYLILHSICIKANRSRHPLSSKWTHNVNGLK